MPKTTFLRGIDRIGEAQLFVLMWAVCVVLVMVAVLGALQRERAVAARLDAEALDHAVDPDSAPWHHGGLQERG